MRRHIWRVQSGVAGAFSPVPAAPAIMRIQIRY